jgi:hypothetical protein
MKNGGKPSKRNYFVSGRTWRRTPPRIRGRPRGGTVACDKENSFLFVRARELIWPFASSAKLYGESGE